MEYLILLDLTLLDSKVRVFNRSHPWELAYLDLRILSQPCRAPDVTSLRHTVVDPCPCFTKKEHRSIYGLS